jgi:hypothetical protein
VKALKREANFVSLWVDLQCSDVGHTKLVGEASCNDMVGHEEADNLTNIPNATQEISARSYYRK